MNSQISSSQNVFSKKHTILYDSIPFFIHFRSRDNQFGVARITVVWKFHQNSSKIYREIDGKSIFCNFLKKMRGSRQHFALHRRQNMQISRKTQKCLGPIFSAPRPKMSNGVQRLGQRAPSGNYLGKFFRRFSRRIPPPRSAKSGNTTNSHVSRTQCSLCCSGGTARAGSRGTLHFEKYHLSSALL